VALYQAYHLDGRFTPGRWFLGRRLLRGARVSVIHLSQENEYNSLVIDVAPDGATVYAFGEAVDAFAQFTLTDAERLVFAASLLRDKETVTRESEASARVETTKGGTDE